VAFTYHIGVATNPQPALIDLALGGLATAADAVVSRGGEEVIRERIGAGPEARFLLFSLTKPLTAAAVLVLVDAGMFRPDATVASLIPAFGAAGKDRVTVEDVLTHRGGFQKGRPISTPIDASDFVDREQALAAICALPWSADLYCVAAYHAFGLIETRLTEVQSDESVIEVADRRIQVGIPASRRDAIAETIPLGRGETPQEAAGGIVFLCSPWSDYVTGQVITLGGGISWGMAV
jgi:CubicO group peptidase (beta-lactamase class C family)